MTTKSQKKICSNPNCSKNGREQVIGNFYSTTSPFFSDSKLHICKSCCLDVVEKNGFSGFQSLMKLIDKPIYSDLFKGDYGDYIRQVASLPQYRANTYEDSSLFDEQKLINSKKSTEKIVIDIDDYVIEYWGNGFEESEYEYLENEKMKLMSSFECPDYGMEMLMKDICFINLEIDLIRKDRKENNQKAIMNLIETRSKLMNDAKMKPIQSTGAEGNEQVTFGTLIKKWESTRPIPEPIDDEMKEYIDTYMVGHLAKMEGLNNEATKKYEKVLSQYTVDFSEVNRVRDEEADD